MWRSLFWTSPFAICKRGIMATPRVTPYSPKRKKGRPSRTEQLLINTERSRFAAKQKLIDLQETAVDKLKELLEEKEVPSQVRLGTIKEVLRLCDELYETLCEETSPEKEQEVVTEEEYLEPEEKGIVVSFGGNN